MEDLASMLRQCQEAQCFVEERLLDEEWAMIAETRKLQRKEPERFEELEHEMTERLSRHGELRRVVRERFRELEREVRRRYKAMGPEGDKRHKELEREVRSAVLRVRELASPYEGGTWVAPSGKVQIKSWLFRGAISCEYCGKWVVMGFYIVCHEDGRKLAINTMLPHYIDANHPITYQICRDHICVWLWDEGPRVWLGDEGPPPDMTIEEEADLWVRRLTGDIVEQLLSILADI